MILNAQLPIKLRPALATDKAFIKSTWLDTYSRADCIADIRKSIYNRHHSMIIDDLLARCMTMVLCHTEEEDEIISYINYKKSKNLFILHYLYTKTPYRHLGMAKRLLEEVIKEKDQTDQVFYTHKKYKNRNKDLTMMKRLEAEYDPYLMFIDL